MDTQGWITVVTLVLGFLSTIAGLWFKEQSDRRRHEQMQAYSVVRGAEVDTKLEVIRSDVNSKTDAAIDMANREGRARGVLEEQRREGRE